MTETYRLKGFGLVGGGVAATLALYLVSVQVAAERKRLEQVNAGIVAAERDVRALETEFDTRANLSQLERWNGETLALVAPTAGQFLRGGAQLASMSFDGAPQAGMRTAALIIPAFTAHTRAAAIPAVAVALTKPAPDVATAKPAVAVATARADAAVASTRPAYAVAKAKPAVAVTNAKPAAEPRSRAAPVAVAAAKPARKPAAKVSAPPVVVASISRPVAPRKTQTVAMLDGALLSDRTLGDLMSRARGEAGRLR